MPPHFTYAPEFTSARPRPLRARKTGAWEDLHTLWELETSEKKIAHFLFTHLHINFQKSAKNVFISYIARWLICSNVRLHQILFLLPLHPPSWVRCKKHFPKGEECSGSTMTIHENNLIFRSPRKTPLTRRWRLWKHLPFVTFLPSILREPIPLTMEATLTDSNDLRHRRAFFGQEKSPAARGQEPDLGFSILFKGIRAADKWSAVPPILECT